MKYLKEEIYYRDRYDRFTVEEGRQLEQRMRGHTPAGSTDSQETNLGEDHRWHALFNEFSLYFFCGERFAEKAATIKGWMDRDRQRDARLERARHPSGVCCLKCSAGMECEEADLHEHYGNEQVLFFFLCPQCRIRRAVFENGTEFRSPVTVCTHCRGEMKTERKRSEGQITIIQACSKCGATTTDTFELSEPSQPVDEAFITDRNRFCLPDAEGQDYLSSRSRLESSRLQAAQEEERRRNQAILDEVAKLKILTIAELQELLPPAVEKVRFRRLELGKPEVEREEVRVDFQVQDAEAGRTEKDSIRALQKLISRTLEGTNWKLMSNGPLFHLGILTGTLRGLKTKADLIELVRSRHKNAAKRSCK